MIKQFCEKRLREVLAPYSVVKITGHRSAKMYDQCSRVLQELLSGEFKGIKETVFVVLAEKTLDSFDAQIRWLFHSICLIVVHTRCWDRDSDFYENGSLRNLLRHELLHVETKWPDDNRLFKHELERRQIQ